MRTNQLKLIGAVAFSVIVVVCASLLAWLNIAVAVGFFLCVLVAAGGLYYRIDKKRSQIETYTVKAVTVIDTKSDETAARGGDITSFLADDPNYHKMVDMFVNNLPKRRKEMQEALDEGNLQDLAFKVHALKGLGSSAGFPIYTDKAGALEQAVMSNQIDRVQEQLDEIYSFALRQSWRTADPLSLGIKPTTPVHYTYLICWINSAITSCFGGNFTRTV